MDLMQFIDMILHVDKTLGTLLAQYGVYVYAVLFAIVFCETGLVVLFFFPGDTLLFIAGAFCATGEMSYPLLTLLLIVAAVTGNTLNYYIGGAIGHRVFTHDYRWLNKDALQRTHEFFERHGGKTIILARFVPVVRTFAPVVAGIGKMSRKTFISFNVIGGFVWTFGVILAGYALADAIGDSIDKYLYPMIAAIIVISLIPPFLEWRKAKKQKPVHFTEAQAEAEAAALHEIVEED